MAETTVAAITSIVNNEWISDLILDYAHDFVVATPFVMQHDLRGKASSTVSVPQWVGDVGTEQTPAETVSLTPETLELTDQTVATAEMGILREVTKNALEDSKMTPAELFQFIVADSGRLLGIAIEDDIVALFSGLSSGVGVTGVDLALANLVSAIAQLRKNGIRAPGGCAFILDDQQSEDLDNAALASVSTTIMSYYDRAEGNGLDNGFVGSFGKYPIWQTGLCDTANAGADVVGALMVDGSVRANQGFAPFGLAISRMPEADFDKDVRKRTQDVAVTARIGVLEQFDLAAVNIITDA